MHRLIFILFLLSPLSAHSSWEPENSAFQAVEFDYMVKINNEQFLIPPSSLMHSQKCYGFTGSCSFKKLGLKIDLVFNGKKIKLPFLNFINGFTINFKDHYIGKRILSVSTLDGSLIALFTEKMWLESEYYDFGQLIFFDETHKTLYVSQRDGFMGTRELGFPIPYSK